MPSPRGRSSKGGCRGALLPAGRPGEEDPGRAAGCGNGESTHSGKQTPRDTACPGWGGCCPRGRGLGERSYGQASLRAPPQIPAPAAPSARSLDLPCVVAPWTHTCPGGGRLRGSHSDQLPCSQFSSGPSPAPHHSARLRWDGTPTTRGPTESSTHRETRSHLPRHSPTATAPRCTHGPSGSLSLQATGPSSSHAHHTGLALWL